MFQAGFTDNVIQQHAKLRGTARSLSPKVRGLMQKRLREVVEGTARAYGAKAELTYTTGYPVLVNEERKTAFAASVAREVAGKDKVNTECAPLMGAEDFAFMLQERPGAFIYIGNGNSAAAKPGLRLQRRSDSGRHLLLGSARGNRARGVTPSSRYCAASTRFSAGSFGGSAMSRWHGGR